MESDLSARSRARTRYATGAPSGLSASSSSDSGAVTAGAVVSTTVTGNESSATFPASSAAEHVTSVVPIGKTSPVAGAQVTSTVPLTSSVALTV